MKIPSIIPLIPNRVWRTYLGGRMLDQIQGKPHPQDSHFPEDWIASTTRAINKGREHVENEGLSKVGFGGKQYYLNDLFLEFHEEMLGEPHFKKYGPSVQFLLKFLDSSIRLHFQCHPTIPFAKQYLNSDYGKTEGYYILNVRENVKDPYIYLGFQHPPSNEEFKETIKSQDTEKLLSYFEKIYIKSGDVFLVPGGLPHAIGEGVLMIEIMEPTDLCVRVEFKRGDYVLPIESRFMNKGIDFAISMFNFDEINQVEIQKRYFIKPEPLKKYNEGSSEYSLIDEHATNCFRLKKLVVKGEIEKAEDSFYVGIVVGGSGIIKDDSNEYLVQFGDKFFIPYKTEKIQISSEEGIELVLALPPI